MTIYGFKTRSILRELSVDSRISITDLAKKLKCSRITASKILNDTIERYQVKFGLEVDEDKLGITQRHLLIIKLEKKPKLEELMGLFAKDEFVNCAFLCKGDFDLIIHALAADPMDYIVWESLLPGKLADYGVEIYPSQLMLTNFGYLPINSTTLSSMAKNVSSKDKEIITLLNTDSRIGISEMASKLNISRTTIHYRMYTLFKNGFIKRFTISLGRPPLNYILAYATNYHFNKTSRLRSMQMMEYYKQYDDEIPLLNTFQLLAPMSGSYRFLGVALFDSESVAISDGIKAHKRIFNEERVHLKSAKIIGIVKGVYPFRNLDINNNYRRFTWSKL
ncbi:MAG: Lrp/AsnC family transcriptional regulator [Candidatus Micrarchaeota archaeon]|nr:Lrp/AsnC family transcriptional regulator [Candidatus Micrarchaeota archaeon]MDE1849965.1 Lrp/AsnC family transcriptional regulator [Candidatus Micrarchaeota archaeon]